jgi:hypothetical protein
VHYNLGNETIHERVALDTLHIVFSDLVSSLVHIMPELTNVSEIRIYIFAVTRILNYHGSMTPTQKSTQKIFDLVSTSNYETS